MYASLKDDKTNEKIVLYFIYGMCKLFYWNKRNESIIFRSEILFKYLYDQLVYL